MSHSNRLASLLAAALLVGIVGACGSERPSSATGSTSARGEGPADCQAVGTTAEGTVHLCFDPAAGDAHGRFVLARASTSRELEISPPAPTPTASDAGRVGHWAWAALGPDGKTILAQWSAECEVPIAFFVDVESGSPTPVTGEADWARSPESLALGWTTDGRAIVFMPKRAPCGSGARSPGVYLYSVPGEAELLFKGRRSVLVDASTAPRTVSELRQAGR